MQHQLDSNYNITTSQSIGCIQFTGTVYAQAFVHSKATHGEAEMALKQDISRTLLARVELLCEDLFLQREAEQELLPEEEQKATGVIELPSCPTQWKLPVRVLATVPEIPFPLSDYSIGDEEPEVLINENSFIICDKHSLCQMCRNQLIGYAVVLTLAWTPRT